MGACVESYSFAGVVNALLLCSAMAVFRGLVRTSILHWILLGNVKTILILFRDRMQNNNVNEVGPTFLGVQYSVYVTAVFKRIL